VKFLRAKGYRTVSAGAKIFKSKGFIGANLEKSGKFVKDKDLFNLWDYLFIKGKKHVFVQFKTNLKGQKWMQPYIKFGKKHGSKIVKYEIWNKFDRKGFKVTRCE
jgi:hypothetical protein